MFNKLIESTYLRHKYGEVSVLDAELPELGAEEVPDAVPDAVRPRPQDVAAGDVVVVYHLRCGTSKERLGCVKLTIMNKLKNTFFYKLLYKKKYVDVHLVDYFKTFYPYFFFTDFKKGRDFCHFTRTNFHA